MPPALSSANGHPLLFWGAVAGSLWLLRHGPMGWIFPMAAVVHRVRNPLRSFFQSWPTGLAFWITGWTAGLLIESFAILANRGKPPMERVLMHPDPLTDLVFGAFYYGLFMGVWWILLRRWAFSKPQVFLVSGLFGWITEQGGDIVIGVFAQPLLGVLMGILVMSVYGIFPALALLLTENRWPPRAPPGSRAFAAAGAGFFAFWAFYGLVVHRGLLAVFPKAGVS